MSLSLSNSMAHSHLSRFVTNGINDMQVLPNMDFFLGKREVFYRRTSGGFIKGIIRGVRCTKSLLAPLLDHSCTVLKSSIHL